MLDGQSARDELDAATSEKCAKIGSGDAVVDLYAVCKREEGREIVGV